MDEEDAKEGEEGSASRGEIDEAKLEKRVAKTKGNSEERQCAQRESGDVWEATKKLMKKKKAHRLFNQSSQGECCYVAKI